MPEEEHRAPSSLHFHKTGSFAEWGGRSFVKKKRLAGLAAPGCVLCVKAFPPVFQVLHNLTLVTADAACSLHQLHSEVTTQCGAFQPQYDSGAWLNGKRKYLTQAQLS